MGQLIGKRIDQSRVYDDPNQKPIQPYDYYYSYPKTVYDAVLRNMDDNSPTLTDELESIYRLIDGKQNIVEPGVPGQLMTWTGMRGQIGAMEVVKSINKDPTLRSHKKVPTERAIGDLIDTKVDITSFNAHVNDRSIHLTDIERNKWNSMAPLSTLQAHMSNTSMHITEAERSKWNLKADQEEVDNHIYDMNNPHKVNAHQVGTYTRNEIDEMFQNIRESFFNYLNIMWDDRSNQASLVEYHPANWNPNYILAFDDVLPDVPDSTLTYFALKPVTDYRVEETQDCLIYIKRPGLTWQEVGVQNMGVGDMVIRYPDTTMFVWVQGRFLKLFTGGTNDQIGSGTSDKMWRPVFNENGELTWVMSSEQTPPAPVIIKGEDGYTPIKGVDYVDGKDGEGVPVGGNAGSVLVKLTDENYDTTWKNLLDVLGDIVISGGNLPDGIVTWDQIKGRPEIYDQLGDSTTDTMSQAAITKQFQIVNNNITEILEKIDGVNGIENTRQDLFDHINDFNNPHRVTPSIIGAVSNATFVDHVQNFDNPHNVTAEQIGLGNVDNTSDLDKPISNATQDALNEILKALDVVNNDVDSFNYVANVVWNNKEAILTFTYRDGNELDVHIPITEIFNSIYYDKEEKELVIILPDGSEHRIDVKDLITTYSGFTSENIQVIVEDDVIKASIVPGSVGEMEIIPSVHLRNSPTTTTQPTSDKSTRIATTEYVRNQVIDNLISYETDRPLSANMGRILNQRKADIDDVIDIINDLEGIDVIDNLDSTNPEAALSANMGRHLDLTKAPRVHTSPSGATYGRATISLFGHTRASDVDPLMDGTVFRGTDDGYYARADHRHPTDITRAPIHWPDEGHDQYEMTGEPRAVIAPDDSNDNRIATTEWVRRNAGSVMYGICKTASTETAKTVTLQSTFMAPPVFFLRQIGSAVAVSFMNEDRSGHKLPTTLDVQDTGPAEILYGGFYMKNGMLGRNHTHFFVFDGTFWRLMNPVMGTGLDGEYSPDIPLWDDDPEEKFYRIKLELNGGTVTGSTTLRTNKVGKLTSLPTPTRDGYMFNGWWTSNDDDASRIQIDREYTEDTTIYAKWIELDLPMEITITYDAMGGTVNPKYSIIESNGKVPRMPIPTKDGYTFEGWYTSSTGGTLVDENTIFKVDTTLYARWEEAGDPSLITITYDPNGGSVNPESVKITRDSILTGMPIPVKDGYAFNGWYSSKADGSGYRINEGTSFSKDTTVYAHWVKYNTGEEDEIDQIILTFDPNTGIVCPTFLLVNADVPVVDYPLPYKEGYSFFGWYTTPEGGSRVNLGQKFTEDTTVYAHWVKYNTGEEGEIDQVTITLDPVGGVVCPENLLVNVGSKGEDLPTPYRPNYTFNGWYTGPNGTGNKVDSNYVFSEDETIYASWTYNDPSGRRVTVKLNPMEGSVSPDTILATTGRPVGDLPDPVRNGFIFVGWYSKPIYGGQLIDETSIFEKSTEIYARWENATVSKPINKLTGYTGFTTAGDGEIDNNGEVNHVYISMRYEERKNNIRIVISRGEDDFSCLFGNGTQIRVFSPKVIATSKTSALIQFQMEDKYPSSSPVQLVYTRDTAYLKVIEVDENGNDISDEVLPLSPIITTIDLPIAVMGELYNTKLEATGDTPILWGVDEGFLPEGLNLSEDGTISGTPANIGKVSFKVIAINNSGKMITGFSITVDYPEVPEEEE